MARAIRRSLILKGTLEAETPLHVGGAEEGIEVDLSLALNGRGEAYVPGTSLAGALRAWMERNLGEGLPREWWGYQGQKDTDDETANRISEILGNSPPMRSPQDAEGGTASRILVEDAPVMLPGGARSEVWHGVGIDRQWGTGAGGIKFEREVLPKGTRIPLELRLDVASKDDLERSRAALSHLAQALADGCIRLGAAGTRGLGRTRLLDSWQGLERDWSNRQGVLALLRDPRGGQDETEAWKQAAQGRALGRVPAVNVTLHWRPRGPLMVKAPRDGVAVDALPMFSADGECQVLVLPGSAIKGLLRSQAECIVRTVLSLNPQWNENPRQRHLDQLAVPLVTELFGNPRPPKGNEIAKEGRRGALAVATCYSRNGRLGYAQWQTIASAAPESEGGASPLPPLFEHAGLAFQHAFHVAVDRWTGGAAESLLYSGVEPFGIEWEPISIRLDLAAVGPKGAAIALLWLVLRDLWEGRLGLGFGVNRSYGAVKIERVQMDGLDGIHPDWPAHVEVALCEGKANIGGHHDWLHSMELAWESWINGAKGDGQ
ncbi:MAG: RAMP superfamily CRISPR-associated protein [Gammaproteobacteria bacterium]